MTLLHRARLALRGVGVDVSRFPASSPDHQAFRAFTSVSPDVIIDVGANDGGFARQCRRFGYAGEMVSFEPGADAYARLERAARTDPTWTTHHLGLGAAESQLTLHVSANSGASSSLLEMAPAHLVAAPESRETATETVEVRRLDEWIRERGSPWSRIAVKVDVQGYEHQVLSGAGDLLRSSIVAVQLELSLVPLYEGAWPWQEAIAWLGDRGFELVGLTPGFADPSTGRLLQFDGVFVAGRPSCPW